MRVKKRFVPDIQLSKNGPPHVAAAHYDYKINQSTSKASRSLGPGKQALRCTASPMARNGAERDRTADPLLAKQVLSQLSYSPGSSNSEPPAHSSQEYQLFL